MEINNILNEKEIIERFKKSLDIKKDTELAEILGVLPSIISAWKKRNSLNHALLIELSELHKIDLNYLFFGMPPSRSQNEAPFCTPLVSRSDIHEYTMGAFENSLSDLPSYTFPFVKNEIETILKGVNGKNSHGVKPKLKALLGKEGAWKYFIKKFVDVHPGFIKELQKRHHNLSKGDIDFCSLIRLGLFNKEIGILLNISHHSVITKKYRLRNKMNFSEQENSLEEYLNGFT